jgi:hypothetical protein
MADTNKVTTRVAQEPHDAADCKINEPEYSHPDVDCGHTVNAGPGVTETADKNTYETDPVHGKVIVSQR